MATIEAVELPTEAELKDAKESLSACTEHVCRLRSRVKSVTSLVDEDDLDKRLTAAPTLADIGRLYVFVMDAESYLDESRGYLASIEEQLATVDDIRLAMSADEAP